MLDRKAFLRPIAHRGLHNLSLGRIENTSQAFVAAIERGYGIECDIRPAQLSKPVVFHDATVDRLIAGRGAVSQLSVAALKKLTYRNSDERILLFDDLLELVAGRVPLFVEIKSEWQRPNLTFLKNVARSSSNYKGPLAFMSFDPAWMAAFKELAPGYPRGIVSGSYQGAGWWKPTINAARAARLRNLLESRDAEPCFFAYEIAALPNPVTEYARFVLHQPVLAWTVRTRGERERAKTFADAPIFEGFEP